MREGIEDGIEGAVVGTALAGAAASLFDHESLEGLTRSRESDSQASEMRKERRDLSLSHLK